MTIVQIEEIAASFVDHVLLLQDGEEIANVEYWATPDSNTSAFWADVDGLVPGLFDHKKMEELIAGGVRGAITFILMLDSEGGEFSPLLRELAEAYDQSIVPV